MSSLSTVVFHCPNDRNAALSPATGVSAVSNSRFSVVWHGVGSQILGFTPDSAAALQVASKELKQVSDDFLKWNAKEIATLISSRSSHLYTVLHTHSIRFSVLEDRGCRQFLFSLPRAIRFEGVPQERCPDQILSATQISQFNGEVQTLQDLNLQNIWGHMQNWIRGQNPQREGIPEHDAPAGDIRTWMNDATNQPLLQFYEIVDMTYWGLTCVPAEMRLFTGLQQLNLNVNSLVSLPEGAFRGLSALQAISLVGNQIASIHEGAFQGLPALRVLYLASNQIASLPQGVFQGLPLHALDLGANRLTSLPQGVFQGLTSLSGLTLHNNGFASLPQGVFQGLTSLTVLTLTNNRLAFLPEEMFQEVPALQMLSISGNPRFMIAYDDLPPPPQNHIAFRETTREFFSYGCRSPFAQLYQLAARGASAETVRESFAALPNVIKNAIYGKIWLEAGCPDADDPKWGEHHAFDDMQVFYGALRRDVRDRFEALSPGQKNTVYDHVYHLARESGTEAVDFDAYNWGELHAKDNILRLIDAMMLLQS